MSGSCAVDPHKDQKKDAMKPASLDAHSVVEGDAPASSPSNETDAKLRGASSPIPQPMADVNTDPQSIRKHEE